jgi:hypothetical protein
MRCPMPMLPAGRKPDHVTWPDGQSARLNRSDRR